MSAQSAWAQHYSRNSIDTENQTKVSQNQFRILDSQNLLIQIHLSKSQTLDETVEHFASRTQTNWKISPLCNHDLMIFVVNSFNRVLIVTGAKAERVVDRSTGKKIVENTIKHFKRGDIYQGLESIIQDIKYEEQNYDPR